MKIINLLNETVVQNKYLKMIVFILFFFVSFSSVAQEIKVVGKVTSAGDNSILPGVSIIIKGTTAGTVTNADGEYTLNVSDEAILVFSFIGMQLQEIPVEGRTVINVEMKQEVSDIDEVVVVGYGVQKKVNLSGAVDAIDMRELENRPIANLSQGLQGIAPNLNIDFTSGEPGTAAQINIRGITSINGGEPLILVDGVPVTSVELNRLSPEDIANISVLKDASSSAIYGARAAYGVVLITTKTGTMEGIQVSYNNNFSWSKPTILPQKTNDPYIYMRLHELSVNNTPWDNYDPSDETYAWAKERSEDPEGTEGVRVDPDDETLWEYMGARDWTNYFLSDYTFSQKHNIQINGKAKKTRFFLSSGYDTENGALKIAEDRFIRTNFRSKVDYDVFNWLTIGNNTLFAITERNEPSYLSIYSLYNIAPTSWDINPDGSWANSDAGIMAAKLKDGGKTDNQYNSTQSTFTAQAIFFKGALKVNSDFTIRKGTKNYKWYYSKYNIGYGPDDIRETGTNQAYRSATFDSYNTFNIYSTFNKKFNKHEITALAGFNQEESRSEWFEATKANVISASLPTIALATGEDDVDEAITSWAIRGAFFRLNYMFKDKYIIEFNGRYDGSSRFPKESRFGFFPSTSVAWRVNQEGFMSSLDPVISNLKLRASFGALGNQNVYDEDGNAVYYGYISSMEASTGSYLIDGTLPLTVSSPQLVSDNYSWETVETLNLGVDLGVFKDKLNATFDIYERNTIGMLIPGEDLPDVLGAEEPAENAGDLTTRGWEFSLSYRNSFRISGDELNFNARFILSDSRAWITKFDNQNKNLDDYYIGQEFGEIWGFESDGLFQTEEEILALDETQIIPWGSLSIVPGWPKYIDQDGNGIIEKGTTVNDPKDLKIIGNSSPRYRFGINLNFDWKGFDISTFIQGIGKKDYYPLYYLYWGFYQQPYAGGYTHLFDFYRPETDDSELMEIHSQAYIDAGLANQNLDAKYPILQSWLADINLGTSIADSKGLAIPQTRYMLSAAYLRIKNITIGYTLPQNLKLTRKWKIDRIRIFMSGENIAEWSGVSKYFDPEAVTDNGYGYAYPFQRKYSFGLNVNF